MAKPKQARKVFTVGQANAMLPLVRAIVGDIASLAADLKQRHERLSRAPHQAALSPAHEEELAQARTSLERDLEKLRELEDELSVLGVELKDYFSGLVDFPALLDDRLIYLCWKAGEEEVGHWHEIDAGFAGRRKLPLGDRAAARDPLSRSEDSARRASEAGQCSTE